MADPDRFAHFAGTPPAASVVIACRNGERHLSETLDSLLAQEWDRPWEVVFADNGSTDRSRALFEEAAARRPGPAMRVVDASERPGKSHALNRGIAAARAEAIVLLDADDLPARGWLRAMAEALGEHDFVAARNELARLNDGPTGLYRNPPTSGIWQLRFPPYCLCTAGATMGFTRRLFDAVGGFDVDFQPEDDEFCIRAALAGFTLRPVPDAVIHYRLRSDLQSIFWQAYGYAKCDVLVGQRYRHLGTPHGTPWRMLARSSQALLRAYLSWRLRRGPRDLERGAALHWKLGEVAGQVAGVAAYRARPTLGLRRPDDAAAFRPAEAPSSASRGPLPRTVAAR